MQHTYAGQGSDTHHPAMLRAPLSVRARMHLRELAVPDLQRELCAQGWSACTRIDRGVGSLPNDAFPVVECVRQLRMQHLAASDAAGR